MRTALWKGWVKNALESVGRARIPSSLGERGLGPGLKRGTEKCHKSYEMME